MDALRTRAQFPAFWQHVGWTADRGVFSLRTQTYFRLSLVENTSAFPGLGVLNVRIRLGKLEKGKNKRLYKRLRKGTETKPNPVTKGRVGSAPPRCLDN